MLLLIQKKENNKPFSKYYLSFIFCLFSLFSFSQENLVSGTVTDTKGELLLGVSIIEQGTSNGVVSDFDGNYSLVLRDRSNKLEFSYIGFETKTISVLDNTTINVSLNASSEELDEVVVIGYGTAKKRDVLGSIGSVKSEEILETVPEDALSALQGRLAGVEISSNGGAPGESSQILIRGISTLSGGIGPLYVVDGQQIDNIDNINPADIASIDVLKDGASAAIYGSKSANGVVLITTKKGEAGFVQINASANTALSFFSQKIPVATTSEYQKYDLNRSPNSTAEEDPFALFAVINNDLQQMISQVGFKNQFNVSFSGGSETAKFYFSTGVLKQDGIVIGSGSNRFTSNLKVDFDLNKSISFGTRMNLSFQETNGFTESSVFRTISQRQPNVPIYNADGSYYPEVQGRKNPVAIIDLSTIDKRDYRASSYTYAQLKLGKGLSFKSTLGVNFRYRKINTFNPSETFDTSRNFITGKEENNLNYDIQNENFFKYKKTFDRKHSISGLLGLSVQKWQIEEATISAIEFNNDAIQTLNNVTRYDLANTGTEWTSHSLSSVFARASYDYNKKYFVAATIRRDGSSRFGSNNQWGNFPSVSVGWSVDKESFMDSLDYLSNFKLRAGYAITGNERIGNFLTDALYNPGYFYDDKSGIAINQLSNADLGWEETAQQNYGIDLDFLKGRIRISVDRYIKTTSNLLYAVRVPEEIGFSTITQNIGSVENKGLEIAISGTAIRTANFKWTSNFNIAFNKNKVLQLADSDGFETGAYFVQEGQPIGNMYGYKNLGVFKYDASNAFTDDGVQLTPVLDENGPVTGQYTLNGEPYTGNQNKLTFAGQELKGGDIIWKDRNNDFKIDDSNDREIIGNGLPDFTGGFQNKFEYKNISLSILFNYKFGNDIYREYDYFRDKGRSRAVTPSPDAINKAWVTPGDDTTYPSLDAERAQNKTGYESNYVSKGDFIRLQNVNFTYKLPKKLVKKTKFLNSLSLNATANNILTFTNYNGYNPNLGFQGDALRPGWDTLRYPNKIEFIIGVKAKF